MFNVSSILKRIISISTTIPVRGRRRDHAQRQMARRKANQLKRAADRETPKLSKFEEMLAKKATTTASLSQQHPSRPLTTAATNLPAKPEYDGNISWMVNDFQPQAYKVKQALRFLREVNDPSILNRVDPYVQLRLDLNMKLERATKFVTDMSKVVVFPHPYPHAEKRLIIAFAKDVKQQAAATEAGAEIVGGPELVKKILKGVLRVDDVDYVACHADMLQDVGALRGLLKNKFPSIKAGNVSLDVPALVRYFQFGIKVNIKADKRYPEYGVCVCNIGKLDWPDDHLERNADVFIKEVSELRPPKPKIGQFVDRALLIVPPELDYFVIDHSLYVPPMPTAEDALEESKKKKKSKKKAAAAATVEEIVEPIVPPTIVEEKESVQKSTAS